MGESDLTRARAQIIARLENIRAYHDATWATRELAAPSAAELIWVLTGEEAMGEAYLDREHELPSLHLTEPGEALTISDAEVQESPVSDIPTEPGDVRKALARLIAPSAWAEPHIPHTFREDTRNESLQRADEFLSVFDVSLKGAEPGEDNWEYGATHVDPDRPVSIRDTFAGAQEAQAFYDRISMVAVRVDGPSYPASNIFRRTKAVPAGPWEPVTPRGTEQ